jgi:hypothetical protein
MLVFNIYVAAAAGPSMKSNLMVGVVHKIISSIAEPRRRERAKEVMSNMVGEAKVRHANQELTNGNAQHPNNHVMP